MTSIFSSGLLLFTRVGTGAALALLAVACSDDAATVAESDPRGGRSGGGAAGASAGQGGSTAGTDSSAGGQAGADAGMSGGSGQSGQAGAAEGGMAGASGGQGGEAGEGQAGSAGAGEGGQSGGPCGCLLGEGPYCGGRAKAEAAKAGCTIAALSDHENDLLKCQDDKWSVLEDCASNQCQYDGASAELNDACVLPVCDCFVSVGYCGSGAAKVAKDKGCQIPLLPEHNNDLLHCPGGKWTVKQECDKGCVEAPAGTPDSCKTSSDYRLPFDCSTTRTCTNGNHTSLHDGKDEYAYDFGMPVGTNVRAMRGGTVLAVRNISTPGSSCYNGGGSSCANSANTVEVKHSDGTVGLYMHLSKGTVQKGAVVKQGDILGKSGNSGYSTGPHLHVQVQQNCGIWWCQSVPFKFVEKSPLGTGTSAKSQNCP